MKKKKIKSGMVEHPSLVGKIADVVIYGVLCLVIFICLVPLWHTLMSSLSDGQLLLGHDGLVLKWLTEDGKPNFNGYEKTLIYNDFSILKSYLITIFYVAANVVIGVVINIIAGYVLYRKPKAGPALEAYILFTMIFSGGLVPTYMVLKNLGMTGTPWSLILPGASNAMMVVLMMNAFRQVPESTVESAELDGAGHFTIMFRILLPQAMGLTMVNVINIAIYTWNAWFEASIYVPNNEEWWPLQLWIKRIVAENAEIMNTVTPDWDKYLVSYCVILIATIPVLFALPSALKRLQKGMIGGAVKG